MSHIESIKQKCQLCNYNTILTYKNGEHISCPICCKTNTQKIFLFLSELSGEKTKHYYFCNDCSILFRYDEENIHHSLDSYGVLYYADIANSYQVNGYTTHNIPTFKSPEKCKELIDDFIIEIEWINFIKKEDCCICLESTCTFTECGHALCKICKDITQKKKCPICRKLQEYKTFFVVDNPEDER